jgi:hypothetical protein
MTFERPDHRRAHERKKKSKIQTKRVYLSKDPRYNLRSLVAGTEDVFHVYGDHDGSYGGSKVTNQLCPLGRHLTEVLAGVELQRSKGNTSSLPNSGHHRTLVVLHQKNLPKASLFCLMPGGRQLLLQRWQQEDKKIRSGKQQTG